MWTRDLNTRGYIYGDMQNLKKSMIQIRYGRGNKTILYRNICIFISIRHEKKHKDHSTNCINHSYKPKSPIIYKQWFKISNSVSVSVNGF